jgi:AraC-like DNA-binding protein
MTDSSAEPRLKHGAVYVRTLAEDLLVEGYSPEDVFKDTVFGLDLLDEENPVADFVDIAAFFERAAILTQNDTLGFERGEQREMRQIGLLCYVGLSSPTVLDFLKNLARYRRVFSDAVEIGVDGLESDGVLKWRFSVLNTVGRRQYVEFGASGIMAILRQVTQRRITLRRASFRHVRTNHIPVIEKYLGCPVEFGAPVNAFIFDPNDLALPLATADSHLYAVLKTYAEDLLQRKGATHSPLVIQVERMIANGLTSGEATQEAISRALAMSPRTLSRRLAREQTTFFSILDDWRKSLAQHYLKDANLSLRDIAFLLGYANLGGFRDAFKRWTGETPRQYRDRFRQS